MELTHVIGLLKDKKFCCHGLVTLIDGFLLGNMDNGEKLAVRRGYANPQLGFLMQWRLGLMKYQEIPARSQRMRHRWTH